MSSAYEIDFKDLIPISPKDFTQNMEVFLYHYKVSSAVGIPFSVWPFLHTVAYP